MKQTIKDILECTAWCVMMVAWFLAMTWLTPDQLSAEADWTAESEVAK